MPSGKVGADWHGVEYQREPSGVRVDTDLTDLTSVSITNSELLLGPFGDQNQQSPTNSNFRGKTCTTDGVACDEIIVWRYMPFWEKHTRDERYWWFDEDGETLFCTYEYGPPGADNYYNQIEFSVVVKDAVMNL